MTLQAALVLIPAGIALYSGVYHLFLHLKSKRISEGHLPFALVCLTIALYDICSTMVYSAAAPELAVAWQRRQLIILSFLGIFMIWFFSEFVKRTSRKFDIIFISLFSLSALTLLFDRSSLTFTDIPLVNTVHLFGKRVATYNEMKPGIVVGIQGIVGVFAMIYIIGSLVRFLIKNPDSSSSAILLGFVVLALGVINDGLVGNGVYNFIYLIEYSFIILAVSMAYSLASRQVALERKITSSEEQLREIINSVPDIIYALDSDGLFTNINEAASKLLGLPTSQILGRHFIDFVHPDDRSRMRDAFEDTIVQHGQKANDLRMRLCNCDGEPVWISINSRIAYDSNGNFLQERGVIRDIRTLKEYEEEVQQLAAAVNQADESIIITDRRGVIEYVNPFFEAMTGFTKEEVIGSNTSILKSGKHNAQFYDGLWSTLRSGKTWRGRFTNRKKDGTLFDENAVISPVMNDEGKALHYVAVKRDITQEVALEGQLRESQKMEAIGRLAGGIAHDFTNSLVVILNSAQMAKKKISESQSDVHELLDQVVAASEKTSSLTSQLLAFSHSHQISPRVMNLNKVINGIDTMIQRMMGSRTNLHIEPSPQPIFVKIDPSQIEQILIHLAVNANDAMPDGGSLTITTRAIRLTKDEAVQIGTSHHAEDAVFGDMAEISVTDCGCGMPMDIQGHAFEPFFTTKGRTKSTGLGLSTVYAIAQKHGGCVDVYSNPGYGTTFRIYLPLADGTETGGKDTSNLPRGSERIMVIEDNMIFRRNLVEQLKSLGYSVFEVDDAQGAISSFRKNRDTLDLVISDLILPHSTGKEVATALLEIKKDANIIFASAYPAEHLIETELLTHEDTFIPKPFSIATVARTVRRALDD